MDDGVSETLHIASLGIDYTFRVVGTGADIAFQLIKFLCNKANLDRQEQRALNIAMRNQGSTTTILKAEDREDFVNLAKQHGLEFQMADISTSKNPSGELISIITPGNQISALNAILEVLGYGRPEVNSQLKNASPSLSGSEQLKEGSLQDIIFDFAGNPEAIKTFQEEHKITPVAVPTQEDEVGHVTLRPGDELSEDEREVLPSRQREDALKQAAVQEAASTTNPSVPVNVFQAAQEETSTSEQPVPFLDSLISHASANIKKEKEERDNSTIQIPTAEPEISHSTLPVEVQEYLQKEV